MILGRADQLLVFCLGRTVCRPTLSYPTLGFLTIHFFYLCFEVISILIRIECLDWPLSGQFQKERYIKFPKQLETESGCSGVPKVGHSVYGLLLRLRSVSAVHQDIRIDEKSIVH